MPVSSRFSGAALAFALFCQPVASAGPEPSSPAPPVSRHLLCGHLIADALRIAKSGQAPERPVALSRDEAIDALVARLFRFAPDPTETLVSVAESLVVPQVSSTSRERRFGIESVIARRLARQVAAFSRRTAAPFSVALEASGEAVALYLHDSLEDLPRLLQWTQDEAYRATRRQYRVASVLLYLAGQLLGSALALGCDLPVGHGCGAAFGAMLGGAWYNGGMDLSGTRAWRGALDQADSRWPGRIDEMRALLRGGKPGEWVFHSVDLEPLYLNPAIVNDLATLSGSGALPANRIEGLNAVSLDLLLHLDPPPRGQDGAVPRLHLWAHGSSGG